MTIHIVHQTALKKELPEKHRRGRRMAAVLPRWRGAAAGLGRFMLPAWSYSTVAGAGMNHEANKKKQWLELPPFLPRPVDASAAARAISSAGSAVPPADGETTAIRWVRRCCPRLPASLVQKLFRLRKVRKNLMSMDSSFANGASEQVRLRRVSAKDVLMPGDVLFLPVDNQKSTVEKSKRFDNEDEITFLRGLQMYKDEAIIAVNKPPGMPVQGGVGIKNSMDVLATMFLKEDYSESPRLVHRLDRDCSGLLILGRNQISASILHAIFREKTAGALSDSTHQVLQRKYVALVMGTPRHDKGQVSAPLGKIVLEDGKSERITVVGYTKSASAQDALTEYRVIESSSQGYTWLELFPLTGRKHQLRVHCAEVLGTPIVGDYKYGWQAHRNWMPFPLPQTIDREKFAKRKLPFGLSLGGGSIAERQPQLHLHCKQMVLPNISVALQQLQSSNANQDFSNLEKLNFIAPLPLHMQLSWEILRSIPKL